MEEGRVKAFRFDELEGKARERARDWYIQGEWESGFGQARITEMFETELEQRGLGGLKPSWSLGYCQGDGVAFEGSIDLADITHIVGDGQEEDEKHIAAIRAALGAADPQEVGVKVQNDGRYSHAYSFSVEVEDYNYEYEGRDELDAEVLAEAILEWLRHLSRYFEKMGYSDIEYIESDQQVAESMEANEYLFSETGEPIHHLLEKAK